MSATKPRKSKNARSSKPSKGASPRSKPAEAVTIAVKPSTDPRSSANASAPEPTKRTEPSGSGKADSLSPDEERFARFVALGMNQSEAYRKVTGTKSTDESVWARGSEWARKVSVRIAELREVARAKATEKYVYEYEDAMRETEEAMEFARLAGDSKALSTAIALRSKLSGLETEARKNERDPFDEMSPEERRARIEKLLPEAGYSIQ